MGQLASGFTAGLKGAAGNPAYSFLDAPSTGFFLDPSGNLVLCRAGVEVLRVTASGLQVARGQGMSFETGVAFASLIVGDIGITGNLSVTGRILNTVSSAIAIVIGPNGTTNPTMKVVTNVADAATGLVLTSLAEASGVKLAVLSSGANEDFLIDAKAAGHVSLSSVSTGTTLIGSATIVTSAAAAAFAVGRAGATDPAFQVDGSVGSQKSGLKVTGGTTTGTVALACISNGATVGVSVDGKGAGIVNIGGTSTGHVVLGRGAAKAHIEKLTLTNITTAGSGSYTAAQLVGGLITRDPTGDNRTDTLDTAVNIIAAMAGGGVTGDTFKCYLVNTADAAETITLAGDTGTTIVNIAQTLAQNEAACLLIKQTGAATVSVYVIGA